jgi:hypothetical protein
MYSTRTTSVTQMTVNLRPVEHIDYSRDGPELGAVLEATLALLFSLPVLLAVGTGVRHDACATII